MKGYFSSSRFVVPLIFPTIISMVHIRMVNVVIMFRNIMQRL